MTTRNPDAQMMQSAGRMWWLWLITGILWILISIVILQFDTTAATTVGFIVGLMFLLAGIQYIVVGTQVEGWKWLWFVFGGILVVAGIVAMMYPTRTFLSIANILGFVFALIGIMWIVEAFATREGNELWWLSLVAGIIMVVMGFWLGGQFLFTKAQTLLIFGRVWAMMRGIMDIVMSFQIKRLADS